MNKHKHHQKMSNKHNCNFIPFFLLSFFFLFNFQKGYCQSDNCILEITKVTYPDTVVPGDIITITATVKNTTSSTPSELTPLFLAQRITFSDSPPSFVNLDSMQIPSIPPNEERVVEISYNSPTTLARNIFFPMFSTGRGELFLKFNTKLEQCQQPIVSSITTLDFFIEYPIVDLALSLDTNAICINSDGIVQADLMITNVGSVATASPIFVQYLDCLSANTTSDDVECRASLGISYSIISESLNPGQSVIISRPFRRRSVSDNVVITSAKIIPELSLITNINSRPYESEVIENPVLCQDNTSTVNCNALNFTGSEGKITVSGLTPQSTIEIIGRNTNWQIVPICDGNCMETQTIPDLTAGEYTVKVQLFGADGSYCYREEKVNVMGGGGTGAITLVCRKDTTYTPPIGTGAIVFFDDPIANTSCPLGGLIIEQIEGLPSGSGFGIGFNTVTFRARDACGNEVTCSFRIIMGDTQPVIIGGQVFNDLNGNGFKEENEPGIPNVTIKGNGNDATNPTGTFTSLNRPGDFQFTIETPIGFRPTIQTGQVTDGIANDSDIDPVTGMTETFFVGSGERVNTISAGFVELENTTANCEALEFTTTKDRINIFGLTPQSKVEYTSQNTGYRVFTRCDGNCATNGDIIPDLETGEYTVKVQLFGKDGTYCYREEKVNIGGNGNITLVCRKDTFITPLIGIGSVVFFDDPIASTNCPLGGLIIEQIEGLPSGSGFGIGYSKISFWATDACGNEAICSFRIGIGEVQRVSISGLVFNDLNKNGFKEENEPGIPNVKIKGGLNTNSYTGGRFSWGKEPGNCQLIFETPLGFRPTIQTGNASDDIANDSDINPLTGRTESFFLGSGERIETISAGFVELDNTTANCEALEFTVKEDRIHIMGLTPQSKVEYIGQNTGYQIITHCDGNCATNGDIISRLETGEYAVKVQLFGTDGTYCYREEKVNVGGGTGCTDRDGDNICAEIDCNDNNPNIGAVGSPCDDSNPNTINDILQTDCSCQGRLIGGGGKANCTNLTFSGKDGQITVSGLTTTYSKVEIIGRNTNWQIAPICDGDCMETQTISDLMAGEYTVKVQLFGQDGTYCYQEERIEVRERLCSPLQIEEVVYPEVVSPGEKINIEVTVTNLGQTLTQTSKLGLYHYTGGNKAPLTLNNILGEVSIKSLLGKETTKVMLEVTILDPFYIVSGLNGLFSASANAYYLMIKDDTQLIGGYLFCGTQMKFTPDYKDVNLAFSLTNESNCTNENNVVQTDLLIKNMGNTIADNPIYISLGNASFVNTNSPQIIVTFPHALAFGEIEQNLAPGDSFVLKTPFMVPGNLINEWTFSASLAEPGSNLENINKKNSQISYNFKKSTDCDNLISSSANCNALTYTGGIGEITVSGLTTSYSKIEIIGRNTNWKVITICDSDSNRSCSETQVIPNLDAGEYTVKVNQSGSDGSYCYREEKVNVQSSSSSRANNKIHFATYQKEQTVQLQWAVNTIEQTNYFLVERSFDSKTFEPLTILDVVTKDNTFHWTDEHPKTGSNHYRVRQIFQNNSSLYSTIKSEEFFLQEEEITLFPNPVQDRLSLYAPSLKGKIGKIQIYSIFGQLIAQYNNITFEENLQTIEVNNLENGLYLLALKVANAPVISKRFVVERLR